MKTSYYDNPTIPDSSHEMAGSFRASHRDRHAHTPFLHRVLSHLHGSMEEALHKGDYILVNKIPGKNKRPGQGRAFTSALAGFSGCSLFIQPLHRYAGRYDPGQHGRIYDKRAENPPFSPLPLFLFHNTERQGGRSWRR